MLSYKNAIIVLIIIAGIAMLGSSFLKLNEPIQTQNFEHTEEKFEEFSSAELEDICAVPEGYEEEAWKEHMSHHPDRYEGCL